jgi:hypothetical protein
MATKQEMLIEANARGLITGDKKVQFDEAVKRGLIKLPASQATDQQLQETSVPNQGITSQQLMEMQTTLSYPAADTSLGAAGKGFMQGVKNVGQGITQRGLDVYEFFGGDAKQARGDLELSRAIENQKYKPTSEEFPVASTVGEIGGSIAALPIPVAPIANPAAIGGAVGLLAAKFGPAAAAGGAFGATTYLEEGEGLGTFAKNVAVDATLGVIGEAAAPYLQKGFHKAAAMFSGIYKKAIGVDPRPEMFIIETGQLSEEGVRALDQLGMTQDEFARIYETLDENLNPIQAARQARAAEEGVNLTQAQITKKFEGQEAEDTLRSGLGREPEAARAAESLQQQQMQSAAARQVSEIADVSEGRRATGGGVQDKLRDIQDTGRQKVSALYEQAKQTPGSFEPLEYDALLDTIDDEVFGRLGGYGKDPVSDALESLMAKYGLVEGELKKAGRFNQIIDTEGKKVTFKGEQDLLSLDNAEGFRQGLNRILPNDQSGTISKIIKKLDATVDDAVTGLSGDAPKTLAFKKARDAARNEFKTFNQKDIVNEIVKYKKGTRTDQIDPAVIMDKIYKGKDGLTNLKQVKAVLMGNPNNKSVDSWKSIQAQGMSDIFADSINPATGDISGQRLSSAIKRFGNGKTEEGIRKLKFLLGDKYKQFDNLSKAIGDATIPLKGVTNTSGTAYKLMNFMTRVGTVGQFGADTLATLASKAKDVQNAKSILRGIQSATPDQVKQAVKANNDLIDSIISVGISRTAQTQ